MNSIGSFIFISWIWRWIDREWIRYNIRIIIHCKTTLNKTFKYDLRLDKNVISKSAHLPWAKAHRWHSAFNSFRSRWWTRFLKEIFSSDILKSKTSREIILLSYLFQYTWFYWFISILSFLTNGAWEQPTKIKSDRLCKYALEEIISFFFIEFIW